VRSRPERFRAPFLAVLVSAVAATTLPATDLHPLAGGPFEASGVAYLPGSQGVLFVDDGRPGEVLWLPLTEQGQGAQVQVVPMGVAVADPEGITTDGKWVYVVGSLSRGTGASLARFRFDAGTRKASGVESMTGLEALLQSAVPELGGAAEGKKGKKGKQGGGINIEGLAWDPKGGRLLLGIRSPVVDGMALAVAVRLRDPAGPLDANNVVVDGSALRIPLGGSGIRGIEYSADAGVFQIIAGHPTGAGDFRLVTWVGAGNEVREVQKFLPNQKPEGVARATLAGRPATVVVFDTSHFAVLP
jgi:hypothetical protein